MSLSYRNQSTDLLFKSVDWFLYDRDLRHERVEGILPLPTIHNLKNDIQNIQIMILVFSVIPPYL